LLLFGFVEEHNSSKAQVDSLEEKLAQAIQEVSEEREKAGQLK